MHDDKKESTILQEKLISVKEEKQDFLEKIHEIETKLHISNETPSKYLHEKAL